MENKYTIYLFGSAVFSKQPNDIDLLVVYDAKNVSIHKIVAFRKKLKKRIFAETGKPAHICLLSTEEKEYKLFIKQENARKIFPAIAESDKRGFFSPAPHHLSITHKY